MSVKPQIGFFNSHHTAFPKRIFRSAMEARLIPALIERSKQRVANFYADFEARLKDVEFVAGDRFSAADITTLVTIDFATKAFAMPFPDASVALKRWYDAVSVRPSAAA